MRSQLICLLLFGCLLSCTTRVEQNQANGVESFYLGGIQVNEPDHQDWAESLKKAGMNTVSVTVYIRHGIWDEGNLWWRAEEPGILSEMDAAKAAGLEVILIPRLLLDHFFEENKFLWHGMAMPKEEGEVKKWFEQYGRFLKQWAEIAEEKGVAMMAIGSELRAMSRCRPVSQLPELERYYLSPQQQERYLQKHLEFSEEISVKELWVRGADNYQNLESYLKDEIAANAAWAQQVGFQEDPQPLQRINERRALLRTEWKRLIREVRQIYSGQLTYAANFDNYQNVAFWEELDVMGINAYFKLRTIEQDSQILQNLHYSWDTTFNGIAQFQNQQAIQLPVLFTELGYINRKNCTVMPWEGSGFAVIENLARANQLMIWEEQIQEEKERSLAIQALYEVTRHSPVPLIGILYWKLTTKAYHLPYEPFALHLKAEQPDSLQRALMQFVK
ncbi:MAG: hypothetical protein AAF985_19480 [Bacteroidota bacterium]